ncbi:MAG: hypothetical protein H6772_01175 [Pseudomonadales bacterium]|nr:hypothetical protein [Pseudomonadales bacterium]
MTAKSRLKSEIKRELLINNDTNILSSSTFTNHPIFSKSHLYIKHLPLLVLGLICYFFVFFIIINIYPKQIANFPITNSYLILQLPLFFANTFLISYLLLNINRGINFSLFVSIVVYLKLQRFIFEYWWFVPIVISFVIVDYYIKIRPKNEKISDKFVKPKRKRN